jgi:uncharacterized membrane protein YbhN (UPF0104 family)
MSARPPVSAERSLGGLVCRAALWSLAFLLLLVALIRLVDVDATLVALGGVTWPLVGLLIALSLANYALRGLRWHYCCRHLDVEVGFLENGAYYIAGFAFTITPGKIGEAVRLWFLKRRYGYGYSRTAGVMIIDRLTDAWPLLLLSLLGVAEFAGQGWSLLLVGGLLAAGSVFLLHPIWLRATIKAIYGWVRLAPALFARSLRVSRMLARFAHPGLLGLFMVLGLVGWFCEILGTWLILDALGAPIALTAAAFVFGFGSLVGSLPIFPGGLGGAEATMIGLLVLLDVPLPTAVAATALVRLFTLGLAVVVGFALLPLAEALSRRPARAVASPT